MNPSDVASPGSSATLKALQRAGLGRRWCALIYESLLLSALLLVAGFALLPIVGPSHSGPSYSAQELYLPPPTSSAFLFLAYIVVAGGYCIVLWTNGRRTLAMKTWRLGLATKDGRLVDVRHATKRYLSAWIGPAAGLAGYYLLGGWGLSAGLLNYYWGWLDPDGQFLHDRIAGTCIIRT